MKAFKIYKYEKGSLGLVSDPVAEEAMMKVDVNRKYSFEVALSPEDLDEFVIGHLFSQGFIGSRNDIESIEIEGKGDLYHAAVSIPNIPVDIQQSGRNYNIIWTECGTIPHDQLVKDKYDIISIERLEPSLLFRILESSKGLFEGYKETGAYHYSILYDERGDILAVGTDIGRHTAFDKMMGKALINGVEDLKDKMVFTTGRISTDIVIKTLNCGIPLLMSRGAPLSGAINLARFHGLTLVGFLRGKRFNLYSNFDSLGKPMENIK